MPVPEFVEARIRDVFGDRGDRWLADLPGVVRRRCRDWGLVVTGEAMTGGTHSYVAAVRRADGSPAALKITVPDEENHAEATALYCYDGDGAVRLLEFDPLSKAMLLELARPGVPLVRQGSDVHIEGRPEHAGRVATACGLYRRLWREPGPVPEGFPEFPTVVEVVNPWRERFPRVVEEHAARFDAGMVDTVVGMCEAVLTPDGPVGIVNRDTHLGNIISGQREPWLLIDPKPLLGERAFDAGFLALIQLEGNPQIEFAGLVVRRTAEWLGVSPERVRTWALLRAVEEISWASGDDPFARRSLAVAEALHGLGKLSPNKLVV